MAHQGWIFTLNNFTEHELETVMDLEVQGARIGHEVGESGTRHLQGALYFKAKDQKRLAGMKKILKRAHFEIMKGSWEDQKYCIGFTKDPATRNWTEGKEGFVEVVRDDGTGPAQGKRSDLSKVKKDIDDGMSVPDLWEHHFDCMIRNERALLKYRDITRRKQVRTKEPEVLWIHGKTGTGKSHELFQGYDVDTHYLYPVQDKGWWDDYDGQANVLINEFRGQIPYSELLDLLDKWPKQVRRRNRAPVNLVASKFVITSSLTPAQVYCQQVTKDDSIAQLMRRITVVEKDVVFDK